MAIIDATVNWPAETAQPEVVGNDPDYPTGIKVTNANTIIRWNPGTNVASVDNITGLPDTEFTAQHSLGNGSYQVNDKKDSDGDWEYTVYATNDQGQSGSHDPKIRNEG